MINHHGFYLIRRPARSIDLLSNFHQQRTDKSAEELLMGYYMGDLLLREAILIASPSLYERFLKWVKGEIVTEKQQLLSTLYKYLIRTTTRCTPFGFFSLCATGTLAANTDIRWSSCEKPIRKVVPDIEIMAELGKWLTQVSATRKQLQLFPNTSIYQTGDQYRYIERALHNGQDQYFISALEHSEALSLILDRSKSGATIPELVLLLAAQGNDCAESLEFIDLLIDNQILAFHVLPEVSGRGSLLQFNRMLSPMTGACPEKERFADIQRLVDSSQNTIKIHKILRSELKKVGIQPARATILKVDSYFSAERNQLGLSVMDEIGELINRLMVLNHGKLPVDLKQFKERFIWKFGGSEVPLALALDDDLGIGYGESSLGNGYTPMIDELELKPQNENTVITDAWWQQFILTKYLHALRNGDKEIKLTSDDLDAVANEKPPVMRESARLAGSFFVFGNIISRSAQAVDDGHFLFNMLACQGPSAVSMLCRFADGIPDLDKKLRACTKEEERKHPDVIFAEIIHYPDSKAGNVLTRPNLYRYQIPYLGQASVPQHFQILIDDLMVSVRGNEIVLRSKRLNKRIIPRLSSMHNYRKGLPVYRFLCDLQEQDSNLNIFWDWGLLAGESYLPRVSFGKLILNRETWILHSRDLLSNAGKTLSTIEFKKVLQANYLPEKFVVVSGDHELFIDLNVPDSIELLQDICRKNETIKMMEFFGTREHCWISDGKEPFFSEFVFPFNNPDIPAIPGFSIPECKLPVRNFLLGSEWLYLKIYAGEKSNDSLIIKTLYPLICNLMEKKIIQQFYFVRYSDPEPHLRLRFLGDPESQFYNIVMETLHSAILPMLAGGSVHNIQTDTYVRELERYGWNNIQWCEQLFQIDSLDTMHFLATSKREENDRFLFAIQKIDKLLQDADYSLQQRHTLLDKLKEGFFSEFKGDSALRKKLNVTFQQYKSEINVVLQNLETGRENCQKAILSKVISQETNHEPVLPSLIHMSVNRLFPNKQRIYELMLYHCLFKHYDGILSRTKQKNHNHEQTMVTS